MNILLVTDTMISFQNHRTTSLILALREVEATIPLGVWDQPYVYGKFQTTQGYNSESLSQKQTNKKPLKMQHSHNSLEEFLLAHFFLNFNAC